MDDARDNSERPSRARRRLGTIFGAAAGIAVTAVAATHTLATADLGGRLRREGTQRLARTASDPETTGSIAQSARAVRFDPCRAAARFPAEP